MNCRCHWALTAEQQLEESKHSVSELGQFGNPIRCLWGTSGVGVGVTDKASMTDFNMQ